MRAALSAVSCARALSSTQLLVHTVGERSHHMRSSEVAQRAAALTGELPRGLIWTETILGVKYIENPRFRKELVVQNQFVVQK